MKIVTRTTTNCGKLWKYNPLTAALAILFLIMVLPACTSYYKITTAKNLAHADLIASDYTGRTMIIHNKDTSFRLTHVSITETSVSGTLEPVNVIQQKYLRPTSAKKNVYAKKDESEVLNEVHLYTDAKLNDSSARFSVPVSAVSKINFNEKNVQATRRSHVVGTVILAGSIVGLVIIMAAALSSSIQNSFSGGINWGG